MTLGGGRPHAPKSVCKTGTKMAGFLLTSQTVVPGSRSDDRTICLTKLSFIPTCLSAGGIRLFHNRRAHTLNKHVSVIRQTNGL